MMVGVPILIFPLHSIDCMPQTYFKNSYKTTAFCGKGLLESWAWQRMSVFSRAHLQMGGRSLFQKDKSQPKCSYKRLQPSRSSSHHKHSLWVSFKWRVEIFTALPHLCFPWDSAGNLCLPLSNHITSLSCSLNLRGWVSTEIMSPCGTVILVSK